MKTFSVQIKDCIMHEVDEDCEKCNGTGLVKYVGINDKVDLCGCVRIIFTSKAMQE